MAESRVAESRNSTIQCCNSFASCSLGLRVALRTGMDVAWNYITVTSKDPSSLLDEEPIKNSISKI